MFLARFPSPASPLDGSVALSPSPPARPAAQRGPYHVSGRGGGLSGEASQSTGETTADTRTEPRTDTGGFTLTSIKITTDFMKRYRPDTRVKGTESLPVSAVVRPKRTSRVLSIYSNNGIYILELYIQAYMDNIHFKLWLLYSFIPNNIINTLSATFFTYNEFLSGQQQALIYKYSSL